MGERKMNTRDDKRLVIVGCMVIPLGPPREGPKDFVKWIFVRNRTT